MIQDKDYTDYIERVYNELQAQNIPITRTEIEKSLSYFNNAVISSLKCKHSLILRGYLKLCINTGHLIKKKIEQKTPTNAIEQTNESYNIIKTFTKNKNHSLNRRRQ